MTTAFDLLLFDLDGTLLDTREDIAAQVNAALRERGEGERSFSDISRWIGRGTPYLFRQLTGMERVEAFVEAFERLYGANLADRTRLYPGARETLEALAAARKVVVSNKAQRFCDPLIERFGLRPHFEAVYGAEAFAARKPDPLPLREACRLAGVAPARAAMIGDSWADVAAAKASGCAAVAVTYGYGDLPAMRALSPEHEIAALPELVPLLARR